MGMKFSWARYDSLRLDPEPGTSIWDAEPEEDDPEPEPMCAGRCDFPAETEIDGEPLCFECIATYLVPDWEIKEGRFIWVL